MKKFFNLEARGTNVKTEFMAGLITFFSMCYILMVNAGMFTELGVSYNAIYIATAISAVVGTLLIGFLANLPLAQASGMGLNAFFVYTICLGFGLSYENALVLVLLEGIIFIILTLTGLRKAIFDAIPQCVRIAITPGIGLFIAFIGLQNSGLVVNEDATLVTLHSFNILKDGSWPSIMPLVVCLVSFLAIVVLSKKNVKGAVLWGILGGTGLYYLLGLTIPNFFDNLGVSFGSPFAAFKDFGTEAFLAVFKKGFDFSAYIEAKGSASLVLTVITSALAFCMVDLFDTIGTLYGACKRGNLLDENGEVINMNKALLADAIATSVGALCGTSTVTTYAESAAGVAEGGKTGLTSVFVALFFAIAMFLSPLAQFVPSCATAAALIFVGVLMMSTIKEVNWDDLEVGVPSFLTVAMMPLTYSISYGIAFGIISYVIINLCVGKVKNIKLATWIIGILFILMLLFTH